jgi:hypothetical protein
MEVETTQVAIAPEKDDIFITLNVKRGRRSTASRDIKIAGNFVIPEAATRQRWWRRAQAATSSRASQVTADHRADGSCGSARTATRSRRSIRCRRKIPRRSEIELTFLVDPGNRAYVRNITFQRQHQHQRQRAEARDPPDGGRLPVERRDRAFEGAPAAPAVHRASRSRDQSRAGHRRTWSTSPTTSRKACPGQFSGRRRLFRVSVDCCSTAASCTATSWVPAIVWRPS